MRIRLYVDEDAMDEDLIYALRAHGVDIITALQAGMIERDDKEHLDYATAQGRVLYSFNVRDYYRLHMEYLSQGKSHAGIILARQQRYSIGDQMRRLLRLIATKSAEEMKNHVEFLSAWG
jgi:hypothetical protein